MRVLIFCVFINESVILLVCIQMSLSFIISRTVCKPKTETNKKYANQRGKKEKRKIPQNIILILALRMPGIILPLNSKEPGLGTV